MNSTAEALIAEALFARLASLALSPALPIAWPNVAFEPPADHRYLRVQLVPNVVNRTMIGSDGPHQSLGLLQVSVHWTKFAGEAASREVAGTVAAHFPADLKLRSGGITVRIRQRPQVRDMIVGDIDVQVPVMIDWESWT